MKNVHLNYSHCSNNKDIQILAYNGHSFLLEYQLLLYPLQKQNRINLSFDHYKMSRRAYVEVKSYHSQITITNFYTC